MKNSKTILLTLALLVSMFFGYRTFFAPDEEIPAEGMFLDPAATSDASTELLMLLNELKGIRMDGAIFSSVAFRSLEDRSRSVQTEPVGRNNPFSIVGTDGFFAGPTRIMPESGASPEFDEEESSFEAEDDAETGASSEEDEEAVPAGTTTGSVSL